MHEATPYLSDEEALSEFCRRAEANTRLALDVEFIRERTYYPKLCLVQLALPDEIALVDPLAPLDLTPLESLLQDPRVTKVLHAGLQDLEIFFYRTGAAPTNIFDTQVAAALLGFGNQVSYAALVDRLLGASISKGESFTDWCRRPLSAGQERYALDDVRYLLPLHDRLQAELSQLGRSAWASEEFRRFEDPARYTADPAGRFRRIRRASSLGGRGLAVLKELALWREDEAKHRDKPRRAVVSDEILVEIARLKPEKADDLRRFRGLNAREAKRSSLAIVEAVARGLKAPPVTSPRREHRQRLEGHGEVVVEFVQAVLRALCLEGRVSPVTVATAADLEALVAAFVDGSLIPSEHVVLRGWRGELVGNRLVAFLKGKMNVRVDPTSLGVVLNERAEADD